MIGIHDSIFLYGFREYEGNVLTRFEFGDNEDGNGFSNMNNRDSFGVLFTGEHWRLATQEEMDHIPDNRTQGKQPANPQNISDADIYYLSRIGVEIFEKWPNRAEILANTRALQSIIEQRGVHNTFKDARNDEIGFREITVSESNISQIDQILKANKILNSNDKLIGVSARIYDRPNRMPYNFDLILKTNEPGLFSDIDYIEHALEVTERSGSNVDVRHKGHFYIFEDGKRETSYSWVGDKGEEMIRQEDQRSLDLILKSKTPVFPKLVTETLKALRY